MNSEEIWNIRGIVSETKVKIKFQPYFPRKVNTALFSENVIEALKAKRSQKY